MKKFLAGVCAAIAVFAIVLMCAENPDGSCNLPWFLSCLAVAMFFYKIWDILDGKEENPS